MLLSVHLGFWQVFLLDLKSLKMLSDVMCVCANVSDSISTQ